MRLEHVGIAADDLAATVATFQQLLGLAPYKAETVAREGVRTHFLDTGAKLELLEALTPESPVAAFLGKKGPGLHHLAFDVDDLDATFARLKEAGLPLLADAPKAGADGKRIFFVHPKATRGVLVEFCADDPDALPEPSFVPFEGGRVATYAFGSPERPPLLVLHGAGGSTRTETLALARQLQTAFYTVAFDLPGHGQSVDADATLPDLVRADAARGPRRARRAGVDRRRTWAATRSAGPSRSCLPPRTRSVSFASPSTPPTCSGRMSWCAAWPSASTRRPCAVARTSGPRSTRRTGGAPPTLFPRVAAFSATIPAFAPEAERLLPHVTMPTLVTAGDRDDLFPLPVTLDLHARLPNASLGILPGLRHRLDAAGARRVAAEWKAFFAAG